MIIQNVHNYLKVVNKGGIMSEQPAKHLPTRLSIGTIAGVLYGLLARLAFGLDFDTELFSTLTWGFLTFVPLALGAVTIYAVRADHTVSAFFYPWLTSVFFLLAVSLLTLEAAICIWMASPFFFLVSGIGGLLMRAVLRVRSGRTGGYLLTALMVAPFVTSPLEMSLQRPDMYRTVASHIIIEASPEVVWEQIIRVPTIQPHERRLTFFQFFGIPHPVEATMDIDSGLRRSTYENGMAFNEAVHVWEPGQTLSFGIDPDASTPLPMPFNEIDGGLFALVDGTYRIEPLGAGRVRLHLISTHRLSTSFNAYGGLWTDFILADLQQYILEIVKRRAES